MAEPKPPKLDFKMFVLPALMFFQKRLTFADKDGNPTELVRQVQVALVTVAALMLAIHYYVYTRIQSKNKGNTSKIYVPPKPKPTLPFGLGPPPEPLTPDQYKETTMQEHEISLLKESVQSIVMSVIISLVMSMKFNVHISMLMQAVMMPLNATDVLVLKKYLLGTNKNENGGSNLYLEETVKPTLASIAASNADKSRSAAETSTGASAESKSTSPKESKPTERSNDKAQEGTKKTDVNEID